MFRFLRCQVLLCGAALDAMSRAQARWEIEAARSIFARRRWALLVALTPVLVALLIRAAAAGDVLPDRVPILGGSKAYMPLFADTRMLVGSVLIGLCAGLITGLIGAGGGYILTPALMSFGVRGIMAVGTDQFHIFAKAIMGATIHRRLGNVNTALAAWFVVGSVLGVTLGGSVNRAVFLHSPALSDAVISLAYVLILGMLGIYAIADWVRLRRATSGPDGHLEATTQFARRLRRMSLRPQVAFDHRIVPGGRSIPVYPVIFCGFMVGFVAAIMGVGGGFLTFPMFVYGLGVSTFTTVGTDILQLVFTTSYSSIFQYALYGFVFYTLSMGMLLGSLVGVQIGAMVTNVVKGSQIRALYALTILAGFCNRLCALPRKLGDLGYISLSREVTVPVERIGTVGFFVMIGVFAVWTLAVFCRQVGVMRQGQDVDDARTSHAPARPARLWLGVAGLVSLGLVMVLGFLPLVNGQSALHWADNLFNQLAKSSTNHIAEARQKARRYVGRHIDISVHPQDMLDGSQVARFVSRAGLEGRAIEHGRVRIIGDLGDLSREAIADGELAFHNRTEELSARRGTSSAEAIYCWWIIFDGLTRRYVQENRGEDANFTRFIATKVLEPAYNFRDIEPKRAAEGVRPLALLLVAYIVFAVWYGFSMLYLFEGIGVPVRGGGEKSEA
jgi:uncharacterized membrane protein YfcA